MVYITEKLLRVFLFVVFVIAQTICIFLLMNNHEMHIFIKFFSAIKMMLCEKYRTTHQSCSM